MAIVIDSWTKYTSLKLNGITYSHPELLHLAKEKMQDSLLADWEKFIFLFILDWLNTDSFVLVKTSGSTGKPKTIQIEKDKMLASAIATNTFFDLDEKKTALLCLSAEYIAGKMMLVRAFVGGFDLHYTAPQSDALLLNTNVYFFTAIVPLQLESALKKNALALNNFHKIIIGGAAIRPAAIEKLQDLNAEFWSTYGMTETITHIALQALNGKQKTDYFQALNTVEFGVNENLCLSIFAPYIQKDKIQTNDRVELISSTQFRFLGRADFIINSGGIKLSPEILERKIAKYIDSDFAFSSRLDKTLGEKLVLVIEGEKYLNLTEFQSAVNQALGRFERPKEIVFIEQLPKTKNGKLDRNALRKYLLK
ncbi:MAG: AMP-binding protein [Bacteroidales bacterium]|nr:AMP-binding protein [Bacteroidales bacterium]